MKAALGLDFGTESVRAMLVDLRGKEVASVAVKYPHGQIIDSLPGSKRKLPLHYALQHPLDWLGSAAQAARSVRRKARLGAADVIGIGVDFTSCTMLPTKCDGTPLCLLPEFAAEPLAWPKLWKHQGAGGDRSPQRRRPPTWGEVLVTLRRCHRAGVVLPEDARDARRRPGGLRRSRSVALGRGLVCVAARRRRG
jgi:hypothetical protein